jgi:hypothetical protein
MKELELEDDLLSKVPVRYVIHFRIKYFFLLIALKKSPRQTL